MEMRKQTQRGIEKKMRKVQRNSLHEYAYIDINMWSNIYGLYIVCLLLACC